MKKILLLSTGGTISSAPTEDGLTPAFTGQEMIKIIPELSGLCEITCKEIMNLDSSNMQPEDWLVMAEAVYSELFSYDGFVITHGTDTMAYSAAALSFMLENLPKPVILTGSQLPIEDPQTDGKRNILDAFAAALCEELAGVFIVFDGILIPGICAEKIHSRNFHAFESVNRPAAGRIIQGAVHLASSYRAPVRSGQPSLRAYASDRVLSVRLTPGFRPELLEAAVSLGYRAVVLEAYGLGGIPNAGRDLLPALRLLAEKRIPVVVTTQCVYGGCDLHIYQVGVRASKTGVISAENMTTEAAVVKLMWILGQTSDYDEICSLFCKELVGEFNRIRELDGK